MRRYPCYGRMLWSKTLSARSHVRSLYQRLSHIVLSSGSCALQPSATADVLGRNRVAMHILAGGNVCCLLTWFASVNSFRPIVHDASWNSLKPMSRCMHRINIEGNTSITLQTRQGLHVCLPLQRRATRLAICRVDAVRAFAVQSSGRLTRSNK